MCKQICILLQKTLFSKSIQICLRTLYQNLGLGHVKNKLTQVETILQFHSPDILFIAESTQLNIRRKDLEVPGMPLIWLHVGNNTKNCVGGFYRVFQRCGVAGSLRPPEQRARFDQFLSSWEKVLDTNADFHLVSDMNLDTQKWRQLGGPGSQFQPLVNELYNRILSRNVVQTVNKEGLLKVYWIFTSPTALVKLHQPQL